LLGVDATVVVDDVLNFTVRTDLGDGVVGGVLEGIGKILDDVNEDDLVTRVVKELGNEATANVAASKVNALHGGFGFASKRGGGLR
jgi:hypothetical protein